jgi:hypothetical protein
MLKSSVIRISIGHFDSEKLDAMKKALNGTYDKLAPGIRSMTGNRSFSAGIDKEHSATVNMSVWDSVESAKQMEHFQSMLDLAREFAEMGVRFERPILNLKHFGP